MPIGGEAWSQATGQDEANRLRAASHDRELLAERYPDRGLGHKLARLLKRRDSSNGAIPGVSEGVDANQAGDSSRRPVPRP